MSLDNRVFAIQAGLDGRVNAVIDQTLAEKRLVGAVVMIYMDGSPVYVRAAGLADREEQRLMHEDALFRLSSVSKPIVSTAALVLAAQGLIKLDESIERWLPDFRPRLISGEQPSITVRQLLTHTAGLTYGFLEEEGGGPYHRAGVSDGMDFSNLTLEENLQRLASVPLLYAPGKAWGYSIATDVLGAIISRVCGTTLDAAVKKLVTEPLGMHDTSFTVADAGRLAAPYVNDISEPRRMRELEVAQVFEGTAGLRFQPARAFDSTAFHSGGSGMIGSAKDFMRLLETLRNGGNPLLSEEWVREMGTIQTGNLPLAGWPGRGFGLGFTVLQNPDESGTAESPGTWRLGGAYGHSWFVDPTLRLSVVAFTNTAFEGMSGPFTTELCQAIYGSSNRV
ncbi:MULTISPECIES: serine hydrolase domain-containing protein [Paenibacillus]|uniref:Serine hydrolase n=1 Tax=Paenibacillus polymyxa TaxID=1406 RepID=A0ABX2ZEF8_PAEPO|nr:MULTISPECIES: serine hydrolase domain-containing protein [Paenibacillus]APB73724.1 serine hydrolase [Paenibacillus polymyxa]ODA09912.1 serine hydrolase [Paenibacillus polymyxa]OME73757.1 serine hydrolase [Paenibacillus peoriae]OMF80554.1 serine hydrolase [Paenibacillus peoriae]